jgi:alcohol dehydrogenase
VKNFDFEFRTKIAYGCGVVKEKLASFVRAFNASSVAIITDKGIVNAGLLKDIIASLDEAGINHMVFDEVEANPRSETCDKGAELVKNFGANVLVAVGGGSSMDTAKAIGVIMTNGGRAEDYEGGDKFKNDPLPVICIPTTAGTGSEVTYAAMITVKNEERVYKIAIASPRLIPKVALLDPTFITTLPAHVAASCGIDALAHAAEAYVTLNESPIASALALQSMGLIGNNLRAYVANRKDIEAAGNMLLASTLAGAAFAITKTNLCHAMSHPLSAHFDIPHGVANAILMPHTLRFNQLADKGKYKKIAEQLGENVSGLSDLDAAPLAIKAVEKLNEDLDIPKNLSIVGAKIELISKLVNDTIINPIHALCPRAVTAKDVENIYRAAF